MQQSNVTFRTVPCPQDLQACRACLATDVNLFDLHKNGLAEVFGDLVKTPVNCTDGYPQYVCYYCQAQLLKCLTFRNMCRKAHVYLQELRVYNLVVNTAFIRNLDKKQFRKPLYRTTPLVLTFPIEVQHYMANIAPMKNPLNDIEHVNLKNEFDLDDDCIVINNDGDINNESCDYENVFEHFVKDKIAIEKVIIKTEDADPTIELKTEIVKEPKKPKRSKAKPAKPVKPKKKEQKQKPKPKQKDVDISNKRFIIYRYKTKPQPEKKFNRYNEKFDVDYEEFSKIYDVTVKSLSKEERIQRIEERKESKEYKESRFSCDVCYKGFMSILAHKRHMKAHDPSTGNFICDVCKMRYPTQRAMNLHARKHKKIFVCNICNMVNVNSARAKVHSKWHKGEKFCCKICDKQLNAHSTLMHHIREVHKKVKCDHCGETLSGTKLLDKHMLQLHAQNECKNCKTMFQSAEALEVHGQDQCGEKKIACVICGLSFDQRSLLNLHMRHTHNEEGKIFACEQCDSVFTSDRLLSRHFNSAHYTLKKVIAGGPIERQKFTCEGCGKGVPVKRCSSCNGLFCSDAYLAHTSNGCDPNTSWCPMCGGGFSSQELMKQHYDDEHKDEYKCEGCNQTISLVNLAKRQIKRRVVVKRRERSEVNSTNGFMCEQCGKSFRLPCFLRYHQRVHTGEKPFQCKICHKSFIQMQNLKAHMRVHTGERPYKCPRCSKAYKTFAARYTHILTHTNQRPYACTTCSKRYTGQTALKEHINTAHRGLPPRQRNKHKQEL